MKKSCTLIVLIFTLTVLFSGCSRVEAIDPEVSKQLEMYNWEYTSIDNSYESYYESDYWNFIDDKYEKMYYEAAVNADFSKEEQKHIYLFYGDEVNDISYISVSKAIQFARLDHPELELMNMEYGMGSYSSAEKGDIYQSLSYYSMEYKEYETKLINIKSEIENLINSVNVAEDIIEKHRLLFNWITSNVKYVKSGNEIGFLHMEGDQYIVDRLKTDSTQNIYGAIVQKKAICDGIADAYKYICNQCGLECITVYGYISDISAKEYHAWNLVKVYDSWYLIDATWDIGRDYYNYFMVKDLHKGDRTPLNIVNNLPGYSDSFNYINFVESTETKAVADNGIIFELLDDENYLMRANDNTIYTWLSSSGMEKELEEHKHSDIAIKTNAQITKVEYFDYKGTLLKVLKNNISQIDFPEYIVEKYVLSMNVSLNFNGKEYTVKIERSGV